MGRHGNAWECMNFDLPLVLVDLISLIYIYFAACSRGGERERKRQDPKELDDCSPCTKYHHPVLLHLFLFLEGYWVIWEHSSPHDLNLDSLL